jgi:hypothetical protein
VELMRARAQRFKQKLTRICQVKLLESFEQ